MLLFERFTVLLLGCEIAFVRPMDMLCRFTFGLWFTLARTSAVYMSGKFETGLRRKGLD